MALAAAILSVASYLSLPFSIQLVPDAMVAVPGQRCVFLATVDGGVGGVRISATAPGSSVTVEPVEISSKQVAEITVIPLEPGNQTLTIRGGRAILRQTRKAPIEVLEGGTTNGGGDPMSDYAAEIRDRFIPWLAANHPELGITDETDWTGTIVRPNFMVVMFYLFFSEEWEMGVSWHVMMPPHDWARVYLRHRFAEARPSYAFEISSLSGSGEPHTVDLESAFAESVWR